MRTKRAPCDTFGFAPKTLVKRENLAQMGLYILTFQLTVQRERSGTLISIRHFKSRSRATVATPLPY